VGRTVRVVVASGAVMLAFVIGTRAVFTWALPPAPSGLEALSSFELRPPLAPGPTADDATAAGPAPKPGQRLNDIRSRGVLRVGYFADSVPWAFVNARGQLVGFDVEAAHALATDLGVRVQFVEIQNLPSTPSQELTSGRLDIVMTGYTATVGRAERMELSHGYSSEHVGFVVRDFDRGRFASLQTLHDGAGITIAVPPVEGAVQRIKAMLPQATTRPYSSISEIMQNPGVTAVLTTLERAFYWSRVRPELAAVRPQEVSVATVVVYAMPQGEIDFKNVVDLWIETRRASGDAQAAYDYWVMGKALTRRPPRWSVLRNILGWQ
jgi:ABC-type amino acid transport substrate-binding protein